MIGISCVLTPTAPCRTAQPFSRPWFLFTWLIYVNLGSGFGWQIQQKPAHLSTLLIYHNTHPIFLIDPDLVYPDRLPNLHSFGHVSTICWQAKLAQLAHADDGGPERNQTSVKQRLDETSKWM